jgi:hypothetical protein
MPSLPRIPTFPKWSSHKVEDWDRMLVREPSGETQVNPASALIINYTMIIGIGEITIDNVDEVYMRVAALEAIRGPCFSHGDRPLFITHEDIRMHVGLITEAPSKTLEEFWRSLPIRDIPIGSGHLEANSGATAVGAFADL